MFLSNYIGQHRLVLSKLGVLCVLSFIILSFVARILFPFGDEPDFAVRAEKVINGSHPFWSPYSIFSSLVDLLDYDSKCLIISTPISFYVYISPDSCIQPLEQISLRWFLMIIIALPLLLGVVLRGPRAFLRYFGGNSSAPNIDDRKNALAVSLVFPGVIYYLGVLAEEQFVLVLSLLMFLFWQYKLAVFILVALIMTIDLGNSIVIGGFVVMAVFYGFLHNILSLKIIIYLLVIQVVVAYLIGPSILGVTSYVAFLAEKSDAMAVAIEGGGHIEKYPVLLRPVITFMTFIFFTPAYVKVPLLYILVSVIVIYTFIRIKKKSYKLKKNPVRSNVGLEGDLLLFSVSVALILTFVFMFPTYGNAKYYVFMTPFLMALFLQVYRAIDMLYFMCFCNFIVFLYLLIYRL